MVECLLLPLVGGAKSLLMLDEHEVVRIVKKEEKDGRSFGLSMLLPLPCRLTAARLMSTTGLVMAAIRSVGI